MATSDHDEIRDLLGRYSLHLDAGDFDGVGALFAHGRLALDPDDPSTDVVGADAVAAFYRSIVLLHGDGTPRTHHVTHNEVIEARPDGIRCRSGFTVFQQTGDLALQPIICGRYDDTFHRVDDAWWFDRRSMRVTLTGDLSHHLRISIPDPS